MRGHNLVLTTIVGTLIQYRFDEMPLTFDCLLLQLPWLHTNNQLPSSNVSLFSYLHQLGGLLFLFNFHQEIRMNEEIYSFWESFLYFHSILFTYLHGIALFQHNYVSLAFPLATYTGYLIMLMSCKMRTTCIHYLEQSNIAMYVKISVLSND